MDRHPAPAGDSSDGASPAVTREIAAEAAVWIARLHGPDRSRRMEQECRAWQARSASHRLAFERCTETWQDVPCVTLGDAFAASANVHSRASTPTYPPPRWRRLLVLGAVVASLVGVVGVPMWRDSGAYATGVGEQRLVILQDGTRLSLNTDTRVHVRMNAARRNVEVLKGEALFEVAKDPRRPFLVSAADSEVMATGTVFSVRLEPGQRRGAEVVSVTLVEGQVVVHESAERTPQGPSASWSITMNPGDRIRRTIPGNVESTASAPAMSTDRPRIESLMAWKRNEAMFDDSPLADAVAELNRYSRTQIALVGDSSLARLRVSGVYRTGDTAGFARDVASLHGLLVKERDGRLELRKPQ